MSGLICPVATQVIWDGREGPHSTVPVTHGLLWHKRVRWHCIYCQDFFVERPDWSMLEATPEPVEFVIQEEP